MSFLLDTDTCSAHLKRPSGLLHRFIQHSGRLAISTVTEGELYVWAFRRDDPTPLLRRISEDLLPDLSVLPFDSACAKMFGRVRADLLRRGKPGNCLDLMIAAAALAHDLTLVTHNTDDYNHVPGLRLEDWVTT
ncbi:MAG: type II toxin-antitoxin system VapC family toxin [Planctomycetes bacterium]|nr:type II toxin-antitoxin system VapC family toxin [Planctomycetota bacterium]